MTISHSKRPRRRAFTDASVKALPRKASRYILSDPEQIGLFLRVPVKGPVAYAVTCRDPYGKQIWTTVGNSDTHKIEEARELARTSNKVVV
jgi:hypothetical protein